MRLLQKSQKVPTLPDLGLRGLALKKFDGGHRAAARHYYRLRTNRFGKNNDSVFGAG